MGLFRGEEPISIKGEMDKLESIDREIKEKLDEMLKNSPDYEEQQFIQKSIASIKIEQYTSEALEESRRQLADAEKGYNEMLKMPSATADELDLKTHKFKIWSAVLGMIKEKIRQLEALRDNQPV